MSLRTRALVLDVDGVLNQVSSPPGTIENKCVRLLATLVRESEAKLVVSSTWRTDPELMAQLLDSLGECGMTEAVILGHTPDQKGLGTRADEIVSSLGEYITTHEITQFVCLDDMDLV